MSELLKVLRDAYPVSLTTPAPEKPIMGYWPPLNPILACWQNEARHLSALLDPANISLGNGRTGWKGVFVTAASV